MWDWDMSRHHAQVMIWFSLKRFTDSRFPEQSNDAQRRAFLIRKGIALQKDENGVEGVAVPKGGGAEKEIKVGRRMSASKLKQQNLGDGADYSKEEIADLRAKNSAGLKVASNSEECCFGFEALSVC